MKSMLLPITRPNTQQRATAPSRNGGTAPFAQGRSTRTISHSISIWIFVCRGKPSRTQFTDLCCRPRILHERPPRREKLSRGVPKKMEGHVDDDSSVSVSFL